MDTQIIVTISIKGKKYTRVFMGTIVKGHGQILESDFAAWIDELNVERGTTIGLI